ncbi:MAG: hypothetical protein AAF664_26215 [Planctomycetota bacterium]
MLDFSRSIELLRDGFRVRGEHTILVRFVDVREIVAFKLDLLVTDLICVGFNCEGLDEAVELDEDTPGFDALMDVVHTRFDVASEWRCQMMFPAFQTKQTTLWKASEDDLPTEISSGSAI